MHDNKCEVVVPDREWGIFCDLLRKYVQAGYDRAAHDALDVFMKTARAVDGLRMSDRVYRLIDARLIRCLREAGIETIHDLAEISEPALLARVPVNKYDAIRSIKRMADEMAQTLLDWDEDG